MSPVLSLRLPGQWLVIQPLSAHATHAIVIKTNAFSAAEGLPPPPRRRTLNYEIKGVRPLLYAISRRGRYSIYRAQSSVYVTSLCLGVTGALIQHQIYISVIFLFKLGTISELFAANKNVLYGAGT